jgi:capsular polysaccharide export protein
LTSPARYLFLQGPASLFFSRLGAALQARGHLVFRINFNGGDRAFWRGRNATDYQGDEAAWPAFLRGYASRHAITDIILLNDCRPLHRLGIAVARELGIATHVFESGYIRPNWLTLEKQGVNGFSTLPRCMEDILRIAERLPPPRDAVEVRETLSGRAVNDVIYSSATFLMSWRYPRYRRDWPYGQATEYVFGGLRLLRGILRGNWRQRQVDRIARGATPFYLLPLQIEADSQIRFHSPYASQAEVIRLVMQSFSHFAPAGTQLVITEHPLETCPTNWRRIVAEQAALSGITERVVFLAGGTDFELVESCRGMLVINSSTGQDALAFGKPLIALAPALYNLPGLTFQGNIDEYWVQAVPADPKLVAVFRRVLIAETQINGGFFSDKGIALAIENTVPALERNAETSSDGRASQPLQAF